MVASSPRVVFPAFAGATAPPALERPSALMKNQQKFVNMQYQVIYAWIIKGLGGDPRMELWRTNRDFSNDRTDEIRERVVSSYEKSVREKREIQPHVRGLYDAYVHGTLRLLSYGDVVLDALATYMFPEPNEFESMFRRATRDQVRTPQFSSFGELIEEYAERVLANEEQSAENEDDDEAGGFLLDLATCPETHENIMRTHEVVSRVYETMQKMTA